MFFVFSQNSRTAVRLKVLEMLASVISANSVLYRVSLTGISSQFFKPFLANIIHNFHTIGICMALIFLFVICIDVCHSDDSNFMCCCLITSIANLMLL